MEVFLAFDPWEAARASVFVASLFAAQAEAEGLEERRAPVGFSFWVAEPCPGTFVNPVGPGPRFFDPQDRALVTDESKIASAVGLLALLTGRVEPTKVVVAAIEVAHARGTPVLGVRLDRDALAPRNLAERCIVDDDGSSGGNVQARLAVETAIRRWLDEHEAEQQRPPLTRFLRALKADRDRRR